LFASIAGGIRFGVFSPDGTLNHRVFAFLFDFLEIALPKHIRYCLWVSVIENKHVLVGLAELAITSKLFPDADRKRAQVAAAIVACKSQAILDNLSGCPGARTHDDGQAVR
jgi:hypothetical protein